MPFNYVIDVVQELVRVKLEGIVTFEELATLQKQFRADSAFLPTHKLLCDAREVSDLIANSTDVRSLSTNHPAAPGARMAVVAAPGSIAFGMARMFEMMSAGRGIQTHVFTDMDEAATWLGVK